MGSEYYPEVVQCFAGENAGVFAYFSDGTIHLYDTSQLLERGGVFERLRDERFFREALTVLNGTVAWDVRPLAVRLGRALAKRFDMHRSTLGMILVAARMRNTALSPADF